ncbi:Kelch repeat-containing protein [Algihabitans albus]|uniref:Kelch repeat-containing protein n=1 Tax=Algihabitans albus TaxID=2164067 RepID=UPI000E5C58B3|nr:kelch repeat-containing protein [Algihabitans albus]
MRHPLTHSINVLCITGALLFGAAAHAHAQADWSDAASLPSPRQEIYATTHDGLIFTAGGLAERASAVRDDFLAYDPQTDSWQELPNLPAARHHITLSTLNGMIYAVGGFSGAFPNWKPETSAYFYDFETAQWNALPDLPVARGEHVAAVVNGLLYVIGGRVGGTASAATFNEHRDTSRVDIFDSEAGTWLRGIDAPTARNSAASAVIDGRIYVVGGRQFLEQPDGSPASVNLASLEVFDPATGLWSVKAPMPQAAGGLGAAAVDGKLYVVGGEQWVPTREVFAEGWVYDPATDEWEAIPGLNVPRHGLAAAAIDGRIHAVGGATETGAGDVTAHEVLTIRP